MNQELVYQNEQLPAAINEGQRAMLTQTTPKTAILTRKGKGGKVFSYVPHAWVTEKLNEAFGWAWSWDIVEWHILPDTDPTEVFVLGKLTVHTPHGELVKSQFGSADVKHDRNGVVLSIGDDLKAASSDALKKAASLLGIALDLYRSDVRPTDDDTETGNLSDDPMTAYWAAVNAKGLTKAEGVALLQKCKGNPDLALRELAKEPAPSDQAKQAPSSPRDPVGTAAGQVIAPGLVTEAAGDKPEQPVLNGLAGNSPTMRDNGKHKPAKTSGCKGWTEAAKALAQRVPYYQKGDKPDFYHMTGAVGKLGFEAITDANLADVIAKLEEYANAQANQAASQ